MVLEEESGLATLAGARRQVDDSKGGQCALSLFGKLGYCWLINFLFFVAIREIFRILNGLTSLDGGTGLSRKKDQGEWHKPPKKRKGGPANSPLDQKSVLRTTVAL